MLPMNAGFASWLLSVVAMVSIPPAEKPIIPMRSGSTCHFAALARTRAKAASASAIWGAIREAISAGEGRVAGGPPAGPPGRGDGDAKASRSAGVWLRRYLSTNAATPLSASARATFQPSFSIDNVRNPPPGATITAAPLALEGSGRNGRSVATVTFRANLLPYWLCHDSATVAPGNGPVPSSIASGCAGVSMAVILSLRALVAGAWLAVCAMPGCASRQAVKSAAQARGLRKLWMSRGAAIRGVLDVKLHSLFLGFTLQAVVRSVMP